MIWSLSFQKFYKWLSNHERINLLECYKNFKDLNYAVISFQGDDRNHIHVRIKGYGEIYTRVTSKELACIFEGKLELLDYTIEDFRKISELKDKVDKWIVVTYEEKRGVIADKFEVRFKKDSIGKFDTEYRIIVNGKEYIFR